MVSELSGQVALVTGATGGLGGAVTRALLDAGAQVIGSVRTQTEHQAVDAELDADARSRISWVELDVTDQQAVEAVVAQTLQTYGRLDILAHTVGGYLGGKEVQDTTLEEWKNQFDLNLTSAFVCCHAVLPTMRERDYGRIVVVSSRSAVRISPGVSAYTASKAALLSLVGSIAEENHSRHVTANAVLPSIIDTAANRTAMPHAKHETWPQPEEIAAVIRFLASPASGLISGASVPVYGRA